MLFWTHLTMYLDMFRLLLLIIKILLVIEENAYLKKYSSLQERARKIGFLVFI